MGSGEWVDKVMVNKQDAVNRVEKSLGCWDAENGNLPDAFYQKYLSDSSKIYPEQSYNMFAGNNQINLANNDDMDDIDAATSDSSEPDLLWQFNQSKFTGITNGIDSKTSKAISKAARNPELRYCRCDLVLVKSYLLIHFRKFLLQVSTFAART